MGPSRDRKGKNSFPKTISIINYSTLNPKVKKNFTARAAEWESDGHGEEGGDDRVRGLSGDVLDHLLARDQMGVAGVGRPERLGDAVEKEAAVALGGREG